MSKLIMLSYGEYSDYGITGVYEVSDDFDKESMIELYAEYGRSIGLVNYEPEEHHMFDNHHLEWALTESVCALIEPGKISIVGNQDYPWDERWDERKRMTSLYDNSGLKVEVDFMKWASEQGAMREIDCEEIHI